MNVRALLLIGGALLLLGGGGYIVYTKTRGLRNNNPGNLRRSGDKWIGLSPTQTDPDFFQFVNPESGIRAMMVTLRNYATNHGLNTVSGIISRWAPSSENDTNAYIADVSRRLGVAPDAPLNLSSPSTLNALTVAIINHENLFSYPPDVIERAARMV